MRRIFTLALLGLLLLTGCRMFKRRERPPFRRISPPVAFEILRDSPDVLTIDLRTRKEFLGDTGHIYRARNIPLDSLPDRLLEIAPFRADTFLVYCRGDQGHQSHQSHQGKDTCGEEGMAILVSSGFENSILIDGGIDAWIESGFRTVLPEGAAGVPLPPSR